ncbi:hypothetical protein AVEN_156102-1 [Araneus ventricosus]|uniref:Uncharacterized protein n=1 Tax=Araneus ventricosus TaxID=182803 RepID=A0A4Y2LQN3_ARAVE|nr:hypothetical protein AVEN_156102-1 [Araneus ventricosus]
MAIFAPPFCLRHLQEPISSPPRYGPRFYCFLGPFSLRKTLLMAFKGVPLRVPVTETFFSTSHFCLTERECLETTVFIISRPRQQILPRHLPFQQQQLFPPRHPEQQEELPPRQVRQAEHQRPGATQDARPERRPGRAAVRHPLRPLALGEEALQDRHPAARQELHPDAGERPRRDEADPGLRQPGRGGPASSHRRCSCGRLHARADGRGVPAAHLRKPQAGKGVGNGRLVPWGAGLRSVREALIVFEAKISDMNQLISCLLRSYRVDKWT